MALGRLDFPRDGYPQSLSKSAKCLSARAWSRNSKNGDRTNVVPPAFAVGLNVQIREGKQRPALDMALPRDVTLTKKIAVLQLSNRRNGALWGKRFLAECLSLGDGRCPLSGGKRTSARPLAMSPLTQLRHWADQLLNSVACYFSFVGRSQSDRF